MNRKIFYVTGTRADFGLMRPTLETIAGDARLDLGIVVTGMHLSERFGSTISEIEGAGLHIVDRVKVDIDNDTGLAMAVAAGEMLGRFAQIFAAAEPDIVLVLGDRLEMLSAAIAATCTNCVIAHLHGGERSGTIDESVRHAISKLAHYHLTSTKGSRDRLLRMGEDDWRIEVVGAPGLVGLERIAMSTRTQLCERFGLCTTAPFAAMLFHPVVQDADLADAQVCALLDAIQDSGVQAVCLMPNADAGSGPIRNAILERAANDPRLKPITHLERGDYIGLIASCDILVGNSSSGILEAGSFGTPVVNIGERQTARERNPNVTDVGYGRKEIAEAMARALAGGRMEPENRYFQTDTDKQIAAFLAMLNLDRSIRKKLNTY